MNHVRSLILLIILVLATPPLGAAAKDSTAAQNSSYAEALDHLGLFSGTGKGYELSRVPTRAEALVMMLRLLGKEEEAQKSIYNNPFDDTSWESSYVSYAYANGIVNGISEHRFGGNQQASLNHRSH